MEPLSEESPTSLYIPEGLGHSFLTLVDGSTVLYLLSTAHNPQYERAVHPLDPDMGITWPSDTEFIMSPKDSSAPGLRAAERQGILPLYTT
jgi:dTDP-4-dehydrorhamnose 3,5-epimerase